MNRRKLAVLLLFAFTLAAGCAGFPGRPVPTDNLAVPAGKIEGNQFTGIRYPFKVSAPSSWKIATEFPGFMEDLGFEKPSPNDKEQTELYIYNPETLTNIQFDLTPATPGIRFSQEGMERMVGMGADSLGIELDKEHGEGAIKPKVSPTEAFHLKGVEFAAKKSVTYVAKGQKREHGWVYGFSEPNQIFIIYMIVEKEGSTDQQEIKKIMDSFEVATKK